jgi:hypothetical protein
MTSIRIPELCVDLLTYHDYLRFIVLSPGHSLLAVTLSINPPPPPKPSLRYLFKHLFAFQVSAWPEPSFLSDIVAFDRSLVG